MIRLGSTQIDVDVSVVAPAAGKLYGRERELARLSGLLRRADGLGKAILVRGEAGIGKSALIAELGRQARERGLRVLETAGVESESDLPFSGLHALLTPALGKIDRLPEPQSQAISTAFGVTGGETPDRFLIGLAALTLLTDLAAQSAVLVIVEDAHWLDTASGEALGFLARRIELEPVVMIFALRDGMESAFDNLGLDELHVEALSAESASALLSAVAPELAPDVRDRVLEEAAGNPLALIELPKSIPTDSRAALLGPEPLPMNERLQRAFSARAHELPHNTQALLLVATLSDSGDVREILAAARLLAGDTTEDEFAPAIAAGLLTINGRTLAFRHPLVRAAVYETATGERRRGANAALAEVLKEQPDRCVWHQAAAAVGPDDSVVQLLDETAERARHRGAASTAMAAFERAARLTASETAQGAYLIRAAGMALTLGRPGDVQRLLGEAQALDLEPSDRSWLLWHLEQFEPRWTGATRVPALVEMANELRINGEERRALQVIGDVAFRCWWGNPPQETRTLVVKAAQALELPAKTPALLFALGLADPVGQGKHVVEQLTRLLDEPEREPLESQELGVAGTAVWADDLASRFLAASANGARAHGRLGLLAQTLVCQAWASLHLGQWETASTSAAEGAELADETAQLRWVVVARLAEAAVAATKGETERADEIAAECEQPLRAYGANPLLALVQLVRGRSLLAAGRDTDAYEEIQRIFDPSEPPYQPLVCVWGIVDFAEAAGRIGRQSQARNLLRPLEDISRSADGQLLHSSLTFARAALAEPDKVEPELTRALASDLTSWPFTRARLLLAQGTWLRRNGRVAASRSPLRAARDGLEALGAQPWAERAAQELRASGEASRPRRIDLRLELTAQELQIARMAADGLTNREIGERLFLSHRTISTHLHSIYPKLGVSSRGQLRRALETSGRWSI